MSTRYLRYLPAGDGSTDPVNACCRVKHGERLATTSLSRFYQKLCQRNGTHGAAESFGSRHTDATLDSPSCTVVVEEMHIGDVQAPNGGSPKFGCCHESRLTMVHLARRWGLPDLVAGKLDSSHMVPTQTPPKNNGLYWIECRLRDSELQPVTRLIRAFKCTVALGSGIMQHHIQHILARLSTSRALRVVATG